MIKVFYGKKGMGKTKNMLDCANGVANESRGNVVYIDDSNELLSKLSHKIRFINVLDYPKFNEGIFGAEAFLGFICGVASQNYDIETLFIDGLTYIIGDDAVALEKFFAGIVKITDAHNVDFYISINGDESNIPAYIKDYI